MLRFVSSAGFRQHLPRIGLASVLLVGTLITGVATGSNADAYPSVRSGCGAANLPFVQGAGFTSGTYWADWLAGAATWNTVRVSYGRSYTSSGTTGGIHVVERSAAIGDSLGRTSCLANGEMLFQMNISLASGAPFQSVASHEAGHGHGLAHSGYFDGLMTIQATRMATCVPQAGTALSSDDYAHLAEVYSTNVTANSGFENQTQFWSWSNEQATTFLDWVFLTTRMNLHDNGGPMPLVLTAARHTVASNYKAQVAYRATTTGGSIAVQIQTRQVGYPTLLCGGSSVWVNNWDLNNPFFQGGDGWLTAATVYLNVSTTWQSIASFPTVPTPLGTHALDLRLIIYDYTTGDLQLDNARIYQV